MLAWFGLGDTDEQVAINPGNSEVSLQEGSAAAISDGEAVEVISVHESQGELADDEHPVSEYGKASSWGISSDGSPVIQAAVPSEDPPRRSVVPPLRLDKLNSFEVEPITSYSPTPEASAGLAGALVGWFNTGEDVEVNPPGDTTKDDSLSGGSSETEGYWQEDRRGEGVGSGEGHDSREEHLREGELLGDNAENLGGGELDNEDRNTGEKFTEEEYQEGEGLVEDGQYQEGEGLVEDGQYQEGEGLVEDGQYQEGEGLVEDGQYQEGEEPVSFTTDDHAGSEIELEVSSTVGDEAESEAEAPAYETTATTQDWVPSLEAVGAAARKSLQRLSVMVSRDGASSEGDVDFYREVELEDDDDEESDGSEATGFETDEEDEQRRGSQDDLRPDSLERQPVIEPLTSNGTSLVGREDVQQAPWEVKDAVLDEEVPSSSSNGASAMSGEEVVMTVDSSEQEAMMVDRRGDHPEDTVAATEHLKGMEIDNSREAASMVEQYQEPLQKGGRLLEELLLTR
ncbi:microneme protein 12, putative [Perkinsus marinus ATCC 50983]|uniref:Microneme protein 12, putative n=1 Tax=Perkinsus marinus (strain ATCC 50983 / TXsc) TaxID=423536 RepID=C5KU16_PERM5|nr:microneme protein 12, putative [Perkinsus marinus ATCC 50983]EER12058.1 microneme protein 12, putative [Perkinsus marinus ATCC 50983]|eukprot:XP_002780263.1 microneme protein 12, putative [Perkinsus marinus ATCC 50983]